jgi:hypothetical protein
VTSMLSGDLQNHPRSSSKSGPLVQDSSTADYRVLGEVIDIAHLVLESGSPHQPHDQGFPDNLQTLTRITAGQFPYQRSTT